MILEIVGSPAEGFIEATDSAEKLLMEKLGDKIVVLAGYRLTFHEDSRIRGSQINRRRKEIRTNVHDAALTLEEMDIFLVQKGVMNPREWANRAPWLKDKPWSNLTADLVHEVGHVEFDRIPRAMSPTKAGRSAPHEAFAEAFSYWIFDAELPNRTREVVEAKVRNWGEL